MPPGVFLAVFSALSVLSALFVTILYLQGCLQPLVRRLLSSQPKCHLTFHQAHTEHVLMLPGAVFLTLLVLASLFGLLAWQIMELLGS
jgi:hypothetical protein